MKAENSKNIPRDPVVAIMGHIDHGKSTLLDYIRKTKVALGEAGGITQHVSAYEAEIPKNNRKIVFLDTPGHEAFQMIRMCGSKIADIVVLVVSSEDGVKSQTLEAIECAKKENTPFMVAISKIDKQNGNIDKTKQGLAEAGIFVEGWGGNIPSVPISGKTGEGVEELLDMLLLQSDLENFRGNPLAPASGFVLESRMDQKRGATSTIIIKNGILKKGMFITAGEAGATVRIMEDLQGNKIEEASFSKPVNIIGWDKLPEAGLPFNSYDSKREAEAAIFEYAEKKTIKTNQKKDEGKNNSKKNFPIIIKADTLGSLYAILHELNKVEEENINIKIISSGVGNINENDIKLAMINKDILVIGFNVKIDSIAKNLSHVHEVEVKNFNIIYNLIEYISSKILSRIPKEEIEEATGTAKIVRIFSANKNKQIVGGIMESGEIKVGENVRIMRREIEIGEGKIKELQSQKIKTGSVNEGKEFGMMIDSKLEIIQGDKIVSWKKTNR